MEQLHYCPKCKQLGGDGQDVLCPEDSSVHDATCAGVVALREQVEGLTEALGKINAIRNHIVGTQTVNWSADIYPLVAALNEAGFEGLDYEEARAALEPPQSAEKPEEE
jgi:hypothetical protein